MRRPLALLAAVLLSCSGARTPPPPAEAPPPPAEVAEATPSPAVATEEAGPHGWTAGTPAVGTADALKLNEPVGLIIPDAIGEKVTGPTLLFYYSPTCPHCQAVMPEINQLRGLLPELTFIGIPSGGATQEQIAGFVDAYGADFEMVQDTDRSFSQAVGARSTPTVYIARPNQEGETPVNEGFIDAGTAITLLEAYTPFGRGMGAILAMRMHPEDPFKAFSGGFQGDRVCSTCHQEEALSWAMTHHSVAYRTLYVKDRAQDLECVGCHVTGLDQPGGFVAGDHGSPLKDVTCESCHGAAGPHDGERQDARQSCVGCHDAEHSIAFDVAKGLPFIDHYQANEMSEPELRARVQALAKGEAEKPLLAFPAGPTTGSAVCADCHKDQHRWGRKDAHAGAMQSLAKEGADDPACVRCHATPTALSDAGLPADTSLSGYRTDEGVGCESCHGPATAHVADPTKGNIVGLGDSCPECVIEAVCTSCHVPRWDPGWDLDKRLSAIPH
jgi:thiol-disulfide isomerase/thioredoxin